MNVSGQQAFGDLWRAQRFWGWAHLTLTQDNRRSKFHPIFFRVKISNVGDIPKRISPKFQAERSHPRGVNGRSKFAIFSIFCVSVFRRFFELQASYRAENLTVDRSRRPGKILKCMLGARAPKKLKKTRAKARSRGRWHARSAENPPHRLSVPRRVRAMCSRFIYML